MNKRLMTLDTADRLQLGHRLRIDRRTFVVEGLREAPTASRPGRLEILGGDLAGQTFGEPEVIHLDAGELVLQAR